MIGFEVIAPKLVALACRRKRQRTFSRGIVRASSFVAVAVRWLATLPFAVAQDTFAARAPQPAAAAATSNTAARAAVGPRGSTCATISGSDDEAPGERLPRRSHMSSSYAIEATARRRG